MKSLLLRFLSVTRDLNNSSKFDFQSGNVYFPTIKSLVSNTYRGFPCHLTAMGDNEWQERKETSSSKFSKYFLLSLSTSKLKMLLLYDLLSDFSMAVMYKMKVWCLGSPDRSPII